MTPQFYIGIVVGAGFFVFLDMILNEIEEGMERREKRIKAEILEEIMKKND